MGQIRLRVPHASREVNPAGGAFDSSHGDRPAVLAQYPFGHGGLAGCVVLGERGDQWLDIH